MSIEFQNMYKYVPFDENRLKILTDGTLYFSSPLNFNDPYDCRPKIILAKNIKDHPLYREARIASGLSAREWLKNSHKFRLNMQALIDNGELQRSVLNDIGVLSLSLKNNNMLMWSHYADLHKGFVINFKRIKANAEHVKSTTKNLIAFNVIYSEKRPICILGGSTKNKNNLETLILTKSLDWKYEEEVRVIEHKNGTGLHYYDRDNLLEGVIAGARMDKENLTTLRRIVDTVSNELGREIKVRQAKLSSDDFKIEIHDI